MVRSRSKRLEVTPEWLSDLEEYLERRGHGGPAEIARATGYSETAINHLRAGRYQTSSMVGPVCKATGLRPPTRHVSRRQSTDALCKDLEKLSEQNEAMVAHLVRSLLDAQKRS